MRNKEHSTTISSSLTIVSSGSSVTLDGSASSISSDDSLKFRWIQTKGPPVKLTGDDKIKCTFTAPDVTTNTELPEIIFKLTIEDQASLIDVGEIHILVVDPTSLSTSKTKDYAEE